jgi:hypothetical protein
VLHKSLPSVYVYLESFLGIGSVKITNIHATIEELLDASNQRSLAGIITVCVSDEPTLCSELDHSITDRYGGNCFSIGCWELGELPLVAGHDTLAFSVKGSSCDTCLPACLPSFRHFR